MTSEMDPVEEWFAANLKAAREDAGMSQETLAARMRAEGHSAWKQQTVTKVENNTRRVLLAEAHALARILDVPGEQLAQAPEVTRDMYALREAVGRFWQARAQARYAAEIHAQTQAALEALLAELRGTGRGEPLGDLIAEGERALKGES
jgi:transcriptional regulator with XRE-family HTH domain